MPDRGAWATGYRLIQTDMPSYVANARQHFAGGFHLTYSNPYGEYGNMRAYFQPQTLFLALLVRAGIDPAIAYHLFGFLAQCFAALVAIRLYERFAGWHTLAHKIGLWCLFWGGGVLSLFGLALGHFMKLKPLFAAVALDPTEGWWMLNFGRNLVSPMEAYYHGLFLLAVLLAAQKRFHWALFVCALTSISHPFTGLSLIALLVAYSALELALRSGAASGTLLAGSVLVGMAHAGYYLVFLHRLPEHRAMQAQWLQEWYYPAWSLACTTAIVGVLAFTRLTHWKVFKQEIAKPEIRLFLVWFGVILALTQHDLVMKPIQPIHFAHGYDWLALFFLALPALLPMLGKMTAIRQPVFRVAALSLFLAVMFSDNLLWFATFQDHAIQHYAISVTPDEKDALTWLSAHSSPQATVITSDENLAYLTPTYTNLRSWYGHPLNTPYYTRRVNQVNAAFSAERYLDAARPLYYVSVNSGTWHPPLNSRKVHSNKSFAIWFAPAADLKAAQSRKNMPPTP